MSEAKGLPRFVSFSGMDGAGKSTQIALLLSRLHRAGFSARVLTFWDDIALLGRVRELATLRLFRGDSGVGSPGNPVNRRDKNVSNLHLNLVRCFLYLIDAAGVWFSVRRLARDRIDVVIFDRYIYDELANLPLHRRPFRAYARLLLKLIPAPDVAFVLDADPVQARQRKPEYPLEFLHRNRAAYRTLAEVAKGVIVTPPLTQDEVSEQVQRAVVDHVFFGSPVSSPQVCVIPRVPTNR